MAKQQDFYRKPITSVVSANLNASKASFLTKFGKVPYGTGKSAHVLQKKVGCLLTKISWKVEKQIIEKSFKISSFADSKNKKRLLITEGWISLVVPVFIKTVIENLN